LDAVKTSSFVHSPNVWLRVKAAGHITVQTLLFFARHGDGSLASRFICFTPREKITSNSKRLGETTDILEEIKTARLPGLKPRVTHPSTNSLLKISIYTIFMFVFTITN
jgi:hypothetical protein